MMNQKHFANRVEHKRRVFEQAKREYDSRPCNLTATKLVKATRAYRRWQVLDAIGK